MNPEGETEEAKERAVLLMAEGWVRQGTDEEGVPVTYLMRPCESAREDAERYGEEFDPDLDPCMIWTGDIDGSSGTSCRSCRGHAKRVLWGPNVA